MALDIVGILLMPSYQKRRDALFRQIATEFNIEAVIAPDEIRSMSVGEIYVIRSLKGRVANKEILIADSYQITALNYLNTVNPMIAKYQETPGFSNGARTGFYIDDQEQKVRSEFNLISSFASQKLIRSFLTNVATNGL